MNINVKLSRHARALCILATVGLLFVCLVSALVSYDRSPWTRLISPFGLSEWTMVFPDLGYLSLVEGRAIYGESAGFFSQIRLFLGFSDLSGADSFWLRPLYPMLSAPLAALVGAGAGFIILNALSWLCIAGAGFEICRRLGGSMLASAAAAAMVLGSSTVIAHVGDFSAHLLGIALWAVGVAWLLALAPWTRLLPWRAAIGLGVFGYLFALTYNTGPLFMAGTAFVAAFGRNWVRLPLLVVPALLARLSWRYLLDVGFALPLDDIEIALGLESLGRWAALIRQGDLAGIALIFQKQWSSILIAPLPVLIAGTIGWVTLLCFRDRQAVDAPARRQALLVAGLFTIIPLLGRLVYGAAINRGGAYSAAAGFTTLTVITAVAGEAWLRRVPWMVWRRGLCAAAILIAVLPGLALLDGRLGPLHWLAGSPNAGWVQGLAASGHSLSLTGQEPTPVLFGGQADLQAAGLSEYLIRPPQPAPRVAARAALAELLPALALAALGFSLSGAVRRGLCAGACGVLLLPALITPPPVALPVNGFGQSVLAPGATVTLGINISPAFIETMQRLRQPGDQLMINAGSSPIIPSPVEVTARYAGQLLTLKRGRWNSVWWVMPPESLTEPGLLEVTLHNPSEHPSMLSGWQRPNLPGRTISSPLDPVPAVSLRLTAANGWLTRVHGF